MAELSRVSFICRAVLFCAVLSAAEEGSWWPAKMQTMLRGWQGDSEALDSEVVQAASATSPPLLGSKAWEPLRDLLSQWRFTENFAVAVGDANGRLFVYEHGNFSMHTPVETASTSKWPAAMMLAGLVDDGTIASLDDPVYKYLSWWTQNPLDRRSKVTFRHLLSFTSGFGGGHPGAEGSGSNVGAQRRARLASVQGLQEPSAPPKACDTNGDITACAKEIYKEVKLEGVPGKVYSYNSNHLQLAGAVAVAASGLTIEKVIQKYLFNDFGMKESVYPGSNPDLASMLRTTGYDYEQFLSGILSYSARSKGIVEASEEDATPFMSDYYSLYGNYGFGHFLLCFDSTAGFTEACRQSKCHIDPGAFGFYPLIDRRIGYYFELVTYETGEFYPRSGIPEYLAQAVKPLIDDIMLGRDISENCTHHTPGFNALSLTDVNYIAGCLVDPKSCQ